MNAAWRGLSGWMRRALPRTWIWTGAALLYLVIAIWFRSFVALGWADETPFQPQHLLLILFTIYYAVYRAVLRHPIHMAGYRDWLRSVPWTPARPLPLWQDRLGGQDAVVVGVLMALTLWDWPVLALWMLNTFLLVYSFGMLWTLVCLNAWRTVYGLLWGAGLLLLLVFHPVALAAGLAVLTGAVVIAERRARRRHPWREPEPIERRGLDGARMALGIAEEFDKTLAGLIGRWRFGLAIGLLGGWWVWLGTRTALQIDSQVWVGALIFCLLLCIIVFFFRIVIYLSFAAPPLGILGRLATGRLIIPGFDRVLLAPLMAGAIGAWTMYRAEWLVDHHASPALLFGAGMAVMLACALGIGPTLRNWALTGHYRARMGARMMPGSIAVNASTPQKIFRKRIGRERTSRAGGAAGQFKPEPVLLMTLPWPGSRDRHARMITWLTLATAAAFMAMIGVTLLPTGVRVLVSLPCGIFLVVTFLVFACTRVSVFHPHYQPQYREWLKSLPWQPGEALPLGPAGLAWRDGAYLGTYLVLLAALSAVYIGRARAADPGSDLGYAGAVIAPTIAGFGFLCLYGCDKLRFFLRVGEFVPGMAVGVLLGAVALLLPHPAWALAGAAAVVAICEWGERRALRKFPWEKEQDKQQAGLLALPGQDRKQASLAAADETKVGRWNAVLAPRTVPFRVGGRESLALILIPAWWLFAGIVMLSRIIPDGRTDGLWSLYWVIGLICYLIPTLKGLTWRVVYYLKYARPPISLWGRLATGRWIIPGFDRVLVTPLAVLASMFFMPILLYWLGASGEWLALAWIVSWSILLLGGPSLRNWSLTAECRLSTEPLALQKSAMLQAKKPMKTQ